MKLGCDNFKKPALVILGALLISFVFKINETNAQSASSNSMPTSGTCGFMINLPIPYGVNVAANNGSDGNGTFTTGGSILGTLTFTSATTVSFTAAIVNPVYNSSNSPKLYESHNIFINDGTITISQMTSSNGFTGGYYFGFLGHINGGSNIGGWHANVVPTNSGKTLLIQLANDSDPNNNDGVGPGSGICQF